MRRQLNLVALAISSMVVLAFIVPLGIVIRDQTADRALAGAQRDAQSIATAFAVAAGSSTVEPPNLAQAIIDSLDQSGRVSIVFDDNTVIGAPLELDETNIESARNGNAFTAEFEHGAEVLVPVSLTAGVRPVVRSFVTTDELRAGVTAAWLLLAGLGITLMAASLFLADRLGRSIVVPVKRVATATRRFGLGERSMRIPVDGPPEVAEVAAEFNSLANRLDALLAAERESVADLSHRLRTPLASLRLQAESLSDSAADSITPEVERLDQAVTELIEAARRPRTEPVQSTTDLANAVRHRAEFWKVLATDQAREMTVSVPSEPVQVSVPPGELGATIDTLIENVFSHTSPGTPFTVQVSFQNGCGRLTVEDAGPGFSDPAAMERGSSSSGSTGLGLDIARRCVLRSGGALHLANRTTGGASVTATFGSTAESVRRAL